MFNSSISNVFSNNSCAFLYIFRSNVIINNVSFIDIWANGIGTIFLIVDYANITISNSIISNVSSVSGGFVYSNGANRVLLINIRTIMIEYGIKTVYFLFSENEGHVVQNAIRNVLKNAWETDVNGKLINGRLFTSSLEKNNLVRRIIITDNTI